MENNQLQEYNEWKRKNKKKRIKLVFAFFGVLVLLIVLCVQLFPFANWIVGFSLFVLFLMIICLCTALSGDRETRKELERNIYLQIQKIIREEARSVPDFELESYGGNIPYDDIKWISKKASQFDCKNSWGLIRAKYRGIPVELCNVEIKETEDDDLPTTVYGGLVIKLTCSRLFSEWIKIFYNDWDHFPRLTKREKKKQMQPDNNILRNEFSVLTSSEENAQNYLKPLIMETIIYINKKAGSSAFYFNENTVNIALWNYRFVFSSKDSFEVFHEKCKKDFKEIAELLDMAIDGLDCFANAVNS